MGLGMLGAGFAIYIVAARKTPPASGRFGVAQAAAFVRFLSGSYSNVVGLPLFETAQLLNALGGDARIAQLTVLPKV